MRLVRCTAERHAHLILDILNDAIATSTALYEYRPRTVDDMVTWFQTKENGGFPVLGLENELGQLLGFASYSTLRAWPAFKYSVEHSVYIHPAWRGRGVGLALMRHLIQAAHQDQVHTLIGGIDSGNAASIALHEKLGFTLAGTLREAGFKFGRWLDLCFYQLILPTPGQPVEDR